MVPTTDKPTLFNPTNHVYFNLTGDFTKTINNHTLSIDSHQFGEIKENALPTGKLINVSGTPFDLTKGASLKRAFESDHPQNILVHGYDHPFFLDKTKTEAAVLEERTVDRRVLMMTTNNAVVVYTGKGFSDEISMAGKPMQPHWGITLEAQIMPDAIHHEEFGNIVLRPGENYRADTIIVLLLYKANGDTFCFLYCSPPRMSVSFIGTWI